MASPFRLLKFLAKVAVRQVGNLVGFGIGGDVLVDVWDAWGKGADEQQKRAELQAMAQASPAEVRAEVERVVRAEAPDLPPEQHQQVAAYLQQVPSMLRRSLRRPADPSGRTVPASLVLLRPEDLLTLLPARPPRFKAGDRPLPGVDWELVELLGVGGFGEVWKAHNPYFDGVPPVALKFCVDPEARERLLKHEAAILNHVMRQGRHEGIVPLQHTYLSADPPCLEYEFVEGGDLAGLLLESKPSRTGLSLAEAARVVHRLATIVGFAHRLKPPIVHRDLKPANILVQRGVGGTSVLRVSDFGIGGLAAQQAIELTRSVHKDAYLTSALRGACTPLYASPQQMRGDPADPRDDVYSLGVIWYQLLTGDLTRGCPTGRGWQKRLTEQGMSEPMLNLLMDCFGDEPADRPDDAAVLAETLGKLLTPEAPSRPTSPVPVPPPPPAPRPAEPVAQSRRQPRDDLVLGIDLGTASCTAAVLDGDKMRVIAVEDSPGPMPSVIAFMKGWRCLVGGPALQHQESGTFGSFKLLLGRRNKELAALERPLPYSLYPGKPDDFVAVPLSGIVFTPQKLTALLLRRLKLAAERELGGRVQRAVITVPASFNDVQRQATLEAARIAGFSSLWDITDPKTGKSARQPMRLLSEPVAVALSAARDRKEPGLVAVVNFGSAHLDVAILDVGDGVFEVKATDGVPMPGGMDQLSEPLVEQCRAILLRTLQAAKLKPDKIEEVFLAGSRIRRPRVRQLVWEVFGRDGSLRPDAEELAARGAALLGAKLLEGSRSDLLLIDVVPLSLGIEVQGGAMHKVIEKNTTTPFERKQTFTTAEDNQSAVTVSVYQGERPLVAENALLGQFKLEGIPPAPRGTPQIEVTFAIDAGGQLNVSAKDLGSGKQNRIRVEGSGRLSDTEIERLAREVEEMVG
ncbi:MAG: Hsp70 family protein [Planctomycetes bacterium]|nr:Hsp70 family protein [Planctomycetota bacterium]